MTTVLIIAALLLVGSAISGWRGRRQLADNDCGMCRDLRLSGNLVLCCRCGNQIPRPIVGHAMPRRKRIKLSPRIALPASELESKIMAMLRGLKECARLKGVGFVLGSFGQEPNWFARPLPTRISEACRRAFVTSLAKVRKEFDLLFPQRFGTEKSSPSNNNGGSSPRQHGECPCL